MEYIEQQNLAILAKCILFGEAELPSLKKYISPEVDIVNFKITSLSKIISLQKKYEFLDIEYYYELKDDGKIIIDAKNNNFYHLDKKIINEKVAEYCNIALKIINNENFAVKEMDPDKRKNLLDIINRSLSVYIYIKPDKKKDAQNWLSNYLNNFCEDELFKQNTELFLMHLKKMSNNELNGLEYHNFHYNLAEHYTDYDIFEKNVDKIKILESILFLNKQKALQINELNLLKKNYFDEKYENFEDYYNQHTPDIKAVDFSVNDYIKIKNLSNIEDAIGWSCNLTLNVLPNEIDKILSGSDDNDSSDYKLCQDSNTLHYRNKSRKFRDQTAYAVCNWILNNNGNTLTHEFLQSLTGSKKSGTNDACIKDVRDAFVELSGKNPLKSIRGTGWLINIL